MFARLMKTHYLEKLFYRRNEAARLLSVTTRTLDHWNERGILRQTNLGGAVGYHRDTLDAFARGKLSKEATE